MQITAEGAAGARASLTSFVGRRDELALLRGILARGRLVTITGPGGSGKTRLAEELVTQHARSFGGGVAVAYLAGATSAADVRELAAAAVGLRGADEPGAALAEYLGTRRFLLVLDNCEHLQDPAARLAAEILASCPAVTIIATSRRPLLVPGEQLLALAGLPDASAIALFTDRVRLTSPSFVITADQLAIVKRLCARLDGMPLAIELAAARLRSFGLADLDQRMTGHLTDLGSVDSVAPVRQRTLRGAVEWSHDLLDDPQRVLWRRLCTFVGGFTLSAAETVAAIPPLEPTAIAPLLGDLVDRSMIVFDLARGRYGFIEAMREYGLERLREAAELEVMAARHRAWMLDRTEHLHRTWWGPDQAAALDEMSAEAANLRAALESCRAAGAGGDGLRIAAASLWYWITRASHAEAARWFVPFLDETSDPVLSARAFVAAAWIAVLSARLAEARTFLARATEFVEPARDPGISAYVTIVTGLGSISEGRLDEGVTLARATLADPWADPMCRSWAMVQLGIVAFLRGDWDEAVLVSRQAIEFCRSAGESWTQVIHLHVLSAATWQRGDAKAALSVLLEALRIDRRLDDLWHRSWTIEAMGWVTVDLAGDDRAARLLGIAAGCWAFTGASLTAPWRRYHETAEATLRRRLGDVRFDREFAAGKELDRVRALSYALEDVRPDPVAVATSPRVSPRELEVAALVAEGRANREIGERLFLSPRTVETHVQHLMDKLGVGSRAEIAAWHAREGAGRPE